MVKEIIFSELKGNQSTLMDDVQYYVQDKAVPHNAIIIKRKYSKEMKKQMNLSGLRDELAQVQTKKKEFLETMDRINP